MNVGTRQYQTLLMTNVMPIRGTLKKKRKEKRKYVQY